MADYHPLIARAVAGLEKNTGENRRALYERARKALVDQLRSVVPALDESEITRERLALEEAIRKIEAESARQAREVPRPPPARRADPPKRPAEPAVSEAAAGAPSGESKGSDRGPAMPRGPAWPESPASAPPRRERTPDEKRRSLADEAVKGFRDVADAPPPPARRPEPPPADAFAGGAHDFDQLAPPQHQPAEHENLWALPLDSQQQPQHQPHEQAVDFDEQPRPRPRSRQYVEDDDDAAEAPPRRSSAGLKRIVKIAAVLAIVGAVGALGWWQRGAIGGAMSGLVALVLGPSPAPTRDAPAPAQRPKITDRIGQPGTQPGGPAVGQRVVLYEEDPDDPQGKRLVGTAVWRTEMLPAAPGRAPEMAVRADVDVPERNMKMTWSLRRNNDPALPASHTIEIMFNLPADAPSGGVQNVPGVLMKQSEQTRGVPLAGLAVKVTPGFFLIGLSSIEADMQRNLQLLKERAWFDVPIVYNNNRRAILAMEKGNPGEQAFNEAFAAWKQ